jgi:hypothetical protein
VSSDSRDPEEVTSKVSQWGPLNFTRDDGVAACAGNVDIMHLRG